MRKNEPSGIYKLQSIEAPDLFYIGSSAKLVSRKGQHFSFLKYNKHPNKKLQAHAHRYGLNDLEYSVIEICQRTILEDDVQFGERLSAIEQTYLNLLCPTLNIRPTAKNNLGFKMSEEAKKNIGMASKGRKQSEETRHKRSVSMTGRKVSEEARHNMSLAQMGKVPWNKGKVGCYTLSEEARQKISVANKNRLNVRRGFRLSEETKTKISLARKGVQSWSKGLTKETDDRLAKISNDTKGNPSIWNKGVPLSEEHKLKLRESHLGHTSPNKGKKMVFNELTQKRQYI